MTLKFYSRFIDCPSPHPSSTTDFYNEEASLGDTMNKTWQEEVSPGTEPKIKAGTVTAFSRRSLK